MELLTFRKYAEHRGCSPMAVSKAVREGRITVIIDGAGVRKINPEVADREWQANTDESKQVGAYTAEAGDEPTLPAASEFVSTSQDGKPISGRAKREEFQAGITELRYRELAGELVNAEEVKQEAFRIGRQTREAVLGVADRVSSQLAAEQDVHKIHVLLTQELTKALEAVADGIS